MITYICLVKSECGLDRTFTVRVLHINSALFYRTKALGFDNLITNWSYPFTIAIVRGRAGQGRDNGNSLWAPGIMGPLNYKLKFEKVLNAQQFIKATSIEELYTS